MEAPDVEAHVDCTILACFAMSANVLRIIVVACTKCSYDCQHVLGVTKRAGSHEPTCSIRRARLTILLQQGEKEQTTKTSIE